MQHRHLRLGLLSLAATLGTACATGSRTEAVSAGDVAPSVAAAHWNATLNPENATTVMGTAVVEPTTDPRRLQIRITVHGAPPNVNLPWHVHRGTCETDLGVVGSTTMYPMLGTSMDGRAQLQTVLPIAPLSGGTYVVKVFAGPGSETVVACGDLGRGSLDG